jgi:hypothetical protein
MKKQRNPLPRSPLYQIHTAASPKSSPDLRVSGSGSGTPLRVSTLRHQFSEGSMPHDNGQPDETTTPPPQGTMSVQRRNLPAYCRPQSDSPPLLQHFLGQDQSHSTLSSHSSRDSPSAADAALDNISSPLDQLEEQLEWQVAWMRGYPPGHVGTSNDAQLEFFLRKRAEKGLRDGTLQPVSGPPPAPAPITANNPPQDIELPPSMQHLRTRPGGSQDTSTSRHRAVSPFHVPHGLSMAQQHAYGLMNGPPPSRNVTPTYQMPPFPQYMPTHQMVSQRQLTPTSQFAPARQFSPINQFAPVGPTTLARQFSPIGQFAPAGQHDTTRQFALVSPFAPAGQYNTARQFQPARRSTPFRQTTPAGQINSGSPVSRSTSSFSGMTSSASSSRYRNDLNIDMDRHSSPMVIPAGPRAQMPANSLRMQRSRPISTPQASTPYERNNQFMARAAYGQGLPTQRPTPPPAVGHGRPRSSEEQMRARNMSRPFFADTAQDQGGVPLPSRQLPQWQRNQENSEEAAMSVLQNEMAFVHVGDESEEGDAEVMNNTPPHESILERYLRE